MLSGSQLDDYENATLSEFLASRVSITPFSSMYLLQTLLALKGFQHTFKDGASLSTKIVIDLFKVNGKTFQCMRQRLEFLPLGIVSGVCHCPLMWGFNLEYGPSQASKGNEVDTTIGRPIWELLAQAFRRPRGDIP